MSNISVIDEFLYDSLLAGNVGVSIFNTDIPEKAVYPCIVYQCISAPDVSVIGGVSIFTNAIYMVKCIDIAKNFTSVDALLDKVDDAINLKTGVTQTNGLILSCARIETITQSQTIGTTLFKTRGGLYRIRSNSS